MRTALCLFLLLTSVTTSHAQTVCTQREVMIGEITGHKYGEWALFNGTVRAQPNTPEINISVYANPRTGTWSMVIFPNNGIACMYAAGRNFKVARTLKAPDRT